MRISEDFKVFGPYDRKTAIMHVSKLEGDVMVERKLWKRVEVGKKASTRTWEYHVIPIVEPSKSAESARDITMRDMLANVGIVESDARLTRDEQRVMVARLQKRAQRKIHEWGRLRNKFLADVTVEMAQIPEVLVPQLAA